MTKKYYDNACDDLINQCIGWLGYKGYVFCWNDTLNGMHVEGRGRKFDIGYEVFLHYAIEKYDDAYYYEKKIINNTQYISVGWRFNVNDFFRNEVGLNNI